MMAALVKRNLLIFFRDRQTVFFSLLGVLIVFGLYVLFLKDVWLQSLQEVPDAAFLMDSWVMAGALAVTSVTTTLGAFGLIIDDKINNISKDFKVSPLTNWQITGSYVISTFIIGMIMSLAALVISEAYIMADGGQLLSGIQMAKVLAIMPLAVFSSSALILFIVSFVRTNQAFSTINVLIGTLIGFITGVYIPISSLPGAMQAIVEIFPPSHAAALYRQVFLETPISVSFADSAMANGFCLDMGVYFSYGDYTSTMEFSASVLIIAAVAFYLLAMINLSRKAD